MFLAVNFLSYFIVGIWVKWCFRFVLPAVLGTFSLALPFWHFWIGTFVIQRKESVCQWYYTVYSKKLYIPNEGEMNIYSDVMSKTSLPIFMNISQGLSGEEIFEYEFIKESF